MRRLIRATTVPITLLTFCRGQLRELRRQYDVVALSSPGPELDELAHSEGIRAIAIPIERRISPLSDLLSLWRIYRAFRRERPDMVHSMTPKAGLLCMMSARLARVPLRVHTFTGLLFPTATGVRRRLLALTDRVTCACATHVIPEGEGVRADLLSFGITKKPLTVLGHGNVRGIDLTHYRRTKALADEASALRRGMKIPATAFVFIFVGRLVGDKGLNELVRAFQRLSPRDRETHLLLLGRQEPELDPLAPATLRAIASLPNIHDAGQRQDTRPWYMAADAMVFPSHREGFPNVVIEAGAMSLPTIATDINGSREIIRPGENGLIVPARDEDALLRAMQRLIDHPEETAGMARNARPMVASRYEQGYVRQCLREYYDTLFATLRPTDQPR